MQAIKKIAILLLVILSRVYLYLYQLETNQPSVSRRYDVKGRKYFSYPNKYYCIDPGLCNARLNFRQVEETHLMENIIYNELIGRGCSVDVGVVNGTETASGKQTRVTYEIDFVVNAD